MLDQSRVLQSCRVNMTAGTITLSPRQTTWIRRALGTTSSLNTWFPCRAKGFWKWPAAGGITIVLESRGTTCVCGVDFSAEALGNRHRENLAMTEHVPPRLPYCGLMLIVYHLQIVLSTSSSLARRLSIYQNPLINSSRDDTDIQTRRTALFDDA